MQPPTSHTQTTSWQRRRLDRPGPELADVVYPALRQRRREGRFTARRLQVQSPAFGQVVDVSEGGLRLESGSKLVAGADYVFRLNRGALFLNLPGQVVWCRLDRVEITTRGAIGIYQAGVELDPRTPGRSWRQTIADQSGAALGV